MKKELIYYRNCIVKNEFNTTENITLSLFIGESVGLLGLSSSGKNELVRALCGDIEFYEGRIFFKHQLVNGKFVGNITHRIAEINYTISDWTVYEYVGLVNKKNKNIFFNKKALSTEINDLFNKLNIDIDVNKPLSELSELDKRIVDLVKCYFNNCSILLIEDEFNIFTTDDLIRFKKALDKVVIDNITVLLNVNSYKVNSILADRYIIIKKGQIVKKCSKEIINTKESLERILLDSYKGNVLNTGYMDRKSHMNSIVYRVNNIQLSNDKIRNFYFEKGVVTSIISINKNDKEKVFAILSGRYIDNSINIYIDEKIADINCIEDFVNNRIVSINNLTSSKEFIEDISIGENILLPSLNKFTFIQYFFNDKKIISMLENQLLEDRSISNDNLDINESFNSNYTVFERWYLFKPKVLVIYEPFNNCDIYAVSVIKSYINKFKESGTSVIIINSRKSDIHEISDVIIKI